MKCFNCGCEEFYVLDKKSNVIIDKIISIIVITIALMFYKYYDVVLYAQKVQPICLIVIAVTIIVEMFVLRHLRKKAPLRVVCKKCLKVYNVEED